MKNIWIIALLSIALGMVSCSKDDEKTSYTVTFDANGGTPVPAAQKVESGNKATAPATPAKTGYVFVYWHLSGATASYNFQTPVASNITLYAKWEEEARVEYWQVSWNLNDGTWTAEDNHATEVVKGGTLAEPVAPVKTGNTFEGWYKEAALTNKITFPYNVSSVTSDFTLYAKWEDATKAGYFGTWRSREDGWEQFTISANQIDISFWNGQNLTLSGLTWTEWENRGGSLTEIYPVGYKMTGTLKTTDGYDIPKADGSGNAAVGDIAVICVYIYGDKESIRIGNFESVEHEALYGPFDKTFGVEYWQITWNLNGGAWRPDKDDHVTQVAKDGKLAVPWAPAKANNTFGGWYKEAGLINKITFPYDVSGVTSDFTLYAKWNDATPSAKLSVSKTPGTGSGFYTSISVQNEAGVYAYSVPTGIGTSEINVVPGKYRIYYSYWACPTVNCMSSGWSNWFTVSKGETKKISMVGSAVGT